VGALDDDLRVRPSALVAAEATSGVRVATRLYESRDLVPEITGWCGDVCVDGEALLEVHLANRGSAAVPAGARVALVDPTGAEVDAVEVPVAIPGGSAYGPILLAGGRADEPGWMVRADHASIPMLDQCDTANDEVEAPVTDCG
jgi:hypothetical protein